MVISYEVFGLCGRSLHSTGGKHFFGVALRSCQSQASIYSIPTFPGQRLAKG
jgi:hypothetical protein